MTARRPSSRSCIASSCVQVPEWVGVWLHVLQGQAYLLLGGCAVIVSLHQEASHHLHTPSDAWIMSLPAALRLLSPVVCVCWCRTGAHPSTQKAAVQLVHQHLGSAAAVKLLSGLSQVVSSCSDVARMVATPSAQQQQSQQKEQGAAAAEAGPTGLLQERAVAARAVMTPRGKP
jgi:hypothetical protein